jgi:uncharacterized protein YbjT (DUF2867 family)
LLQLVFTQNNMIYITGATGGIGSELCRLLAKENIPTRAMYRKVEQKAQFDALGIEAVQADFEDHQSLQDGMQGCDKLFLLTHPDEKHFKREKSIIDIAVEAGIKRIVRISTAGTNLSSKVSYARSHAEVDHYLRSMPVSWTLLRPTGFMQNFLESGHLIGKGMLPHLIRNGQISYIDLRDIASVAKTVLTEPTHAGATYYLTGPESLTVKQVAEKLTKSLGFVIKEIQTPPADMKKALTNAGLSAWHIEALMEQFEIGANGGEIDVTWEVERLTWRAPRRFEQFIMDNKSEFIKH